MEDYTYIESETAVYVAGADEIPYGMTHGRL